MPGHRQSGFTLIEALFALALIGVALLLGLSLIWQQPRIQKRLAARQQALRAAEAVLEGVRAGTVPLVPGGGRAAPGGRVTGGAEEPLLRMTVEDDRALPDLKHVTVSAHYRVWGETRSVRVETMVWRRGSGPTGGAAK